MIKSAGQVSPHVPVCFGTGAAPLTSPNSCKFSVKSCLLLCESAREPLSLPAPRLAHVTAGLEPSPAPMGARLGMARAETRLPQAGGLAWHGIHQQPLSPTLLLLLLKVFLESSVFQILVSPDEIPCSSNHLILWSSQRPWKLSFWLFRWDIQRKENMILCSLKQYTCYNLQASL